MPSPLIVACYVVANEEDSIAESIRSIKPYVDAIIVVDSLFLANASAPPEVANSTDNTRAIVERVCDAEPARPLSYVTPTSRMTQTEARNMYLEMVKEDDWIFVIDGDEVLYGDHAAMAKFFDAIHANLLAAPWDISIFTQALLLPKNAPDITADEFATAPIISTLGTMPRLFPASPALRYMTPAGASTPVLTYFHQPLPVFLHTDLRVPVSQMFLINHHTRQTYESYLNDYDWETNEVVPFESVP